MTWLTNNKKFTVWIVITVVLVAIVALEAFSIPTDNTFKGTVLGAWLMGTKEWLDGKPDNLK